MIGILPRHHQCEGALFSTTHTDMHLILCSRESLTDDWSSIRGKRSVCHDLGESCRGHASLYFPDVWRRQQQTRCLKAKQCKSEHVLCKLYYMYISKAAEAQIHQAGLPATHLAEWHWTCLQFAAMQSNSSLAAHCAHHSSVLPRRV